MLKQYPNESSVFIRQGKRKEGREKSERIGSVSLHITNPFGLFCTK